MDIRWNQAADAVEAAIGRFSVALSGKSLPCGCTAGDKANFNPAQPRDEFGRWTDTGPGRPQSDRSRLFSAGLPSDCAREVAEAELRCLEYWMSLDIGPSLRGKSPRDCVRGLVSERCGGSPVRYRNESRQIAFKEADMAPKWSRVPELDRALIDAVTNRDYERPLEICDRYCEEHPTDPEGYSSRCKLHQLMDEHGQALTDFNLVLRHTPRPNAGHFAIRAQILMRLGRWHEALPDLDRVEQMDEDDWFGDYNRLQRAKCHLMLGDLDAAEAECDRIADDYTYPGFMDKLAGSKFDVLERIAAIRAGG